METCPQCGRRLVSHISPKCNWCGAVIQDAAYQAQAQVNRASYRAEGAMHDAQSLSFYQNAMTPFPPYVGAPPLGMPGAYYRYQQRLAQMEAARTSAVQHAQQMQAIAGVASVEPSLTAAPSVAPSFGTGVPPAFPDLYAQDAEQPQASAADQSRFDHLEF
jgi:hypothetical protein